MTDLNNVDQTDSIQPLPEDHDTPFSPPSSVEDSDTEKPVDPTHQMFDSNSNIDNQEAYDRGTSRAAGAEEPNADSVVTGYNPDTDTRIHPELIYDEDDTEKA